MKKWISYLIDAILVALIGVLVYVQVSMLITKDRNYGVPSAFGKSFLYVATESMDDPEQKNGLAKGHGIIISKITSYESLRTSNPIYDEDNETIIDYDKTGDVITFYYDFVKAPDTHRLINKEFNSETGLWEFETMGDNPEAHRLKKTEHFTQKELIGRMEYHSKAFGSFLTIASPAAAASAGKSAWFFPVAIIIPVFGLAIYYIVDAILKYRKESKAREALIMQKMTDAGIDQNDDENCSFYLLCE